jgi:uncharacterized membrane-anchored protein YjiN (DUF445 family)
MTEVEMLMRVAKRLLLREAENRSLREVIENMPNSPSPERLGRQLLDMENRIQNSQKYRERVAELQSAFDAHTDAAALIRTLHSEILDRVPIPSD